MNLFYQPLIPEGVSYLDEEESRHCIKVLRRRKDDELTITDGKGTLYEAIITNASSSRCEFRITKSHTSPKKDYFIHVAVSPTKNADRLEWFTEKATEFGIDRITPLNCDHTERTFLKTERLSKVAVSAMKQSLNTYLPEIRPLTAFNDLIQRADEKEKFIAHVDITNPDHLFDLAAPKKSYLILIGPEGDFSTEELAAAASAGFKKVSLGQSRLRTETAAVAVAHILNLVNR